MLLVSALSLPLLPQLPQIPQFHVLNLVIQVLLLLLLHTLQLLVQPYHLLLQRLDFLPKNLVSSFLRFVLEFEFLDLVELLLVFLFKFLELGVLLRILLTVRVVSLTYGFEL